jgi:DNA repair exonuclease SbcCD ATPase subunit
MSGKTLGWSGDANNPTSLAVGIAKLETFCRNLEDKIDKNEESADDVVKLRVELDELKGKVSELKARLVSIEDLQEDVESAKKILKMLNPKTLLAGVAMMMGGTVGGSAVVDSITGDETVIEEKVEDQDNKYENLMKRIKELEAEAEAQ